MVIDIILLFDINNVINPNPFSNKLLLFLRLSSILPCWKPIDRYFWSLRNEESKGLKVRPRLRHFIARSAMNYLLKS